MKNTLQVFLKHQNFEIKITSKNFKDLTSIRIIQDMAVKKKSNNKKKKIKKSTPKPKKQTKASLKKT